ncbi:MAG TPA: ribonuclease domain-containing protein [Thermoanaerobaculia bacterium]|nr:ribonuclease domain-containing protein [Thermoanaerobaculia bacterium]
MRPRAKRIGPIVAALIAIFVAVWLQRGNEPKPAAQPAPTTAARVGAPTPAPTTTVAETTTAAEAQSLSSLARIAPAERAEVEKTLALIEKGGPFPHRQDGTVFSNRENRLPRQARGYYREYTVETPGASTRGARRIVRGRDGETYYTNDHYETFIRIDA